MDQDQTQIAPAVEQGCRVSLVYDGQPWIAERLKGTRCHVHFTNTTNPKDGMTWAAPTEEMGDLAWRIYHANYQPTREELFSMLSVIDSFRSLLRKDQRRQRVLARALRRATEANMD